MKRSTFALMCVLFLLFTSIAGSAIYTSWRSPNPDPNLWLYLIFDAILFGTVIGVIIAVIASNSFKELLFTK